MGQRHQVYLVLPEECKRSKLFKDYGEKEIVYSNIIPIHHQWLYGQIAIKQLMYFLKYCKGVQKDVLKDEEATCYHPFVKDICSHHAAQNFKALYSCNPEGYWHEVSIEPYELVKDPRIGDNNDGITIINLQDITHIQYCMMYLWDDTDTGIVAYKPMTALEYVRIYYPTGEKYYNLSEEESRALEKENDTIVSVIEEIAQCMNVDEVLKFFPTLKD